MKITFSNLGRIKKTSLDLRPLTVIIGKNNTNKTYVAYSIYGLLTSNRNIDLTKVSEKVSFSQTPSGGFQFELNSHLYQWLLRVATSFSKDNQSAFKRNMTDFFSETKSENFSRTDFKVEITEEDIEAALLGLDGQSAEWKPSNRLYQMRIKCADGFITCDLHPRRQEPDPLPDPAQFLAIFLDSALFSSHILPVERMTLITSFKVFSLGLYGRARKILGLPSQGQGNLSLPGFEPASQRIPLPIPISDFLEFLERVEALGGAKTKFPFRKLADVIEEKLYPGSRLILRKSGLTGKEFRLSVRDSQKGGKEEIDIGLQLASSSIKQLVPLLLFLRFQATENQLLIIDEPEMGLHPEAQAKLLEVLAILVNLGVKVLVTTHSPYFMAHLNNLLNDETDAKTLRRQASALYLKDSRAFLPANKISAYEMKDKGAEGCVLEDLHDPDYGIRWDTLSDVSVDIQQKYFEIAAKGRKSTNGKKR
jgi:predicted ATPase